MIREAVKVGETYAVLNPSLHDRSKARPLHVVDTLGTNHARGYYIDGRRDLAKLHPSEDVAVNYRLIRMTWDDWQAGVEPEPKHYKHKKPAEWLRRIANHPDASPELALAARNQLEGL